MLFHSLHSTYAQLTISKILINDCVMKGHHAYEPVESVGDTYECQPEINNRYDITTVFVDTRLWKTKHPRKRFLSFRQSCVLSTDQIEIHQSQPLV